MAGIMAGKVVALTLKTNDSTKLINYEKIWRDKFGSEFEKQNMARKILSRIDNQTINKLFDSITPEIIKEISTKEDFDFHTSSIIKLLGIKGSFNAAQLLITGELKKLITHQG
jgi:flavin-dependent dehydrogenase